MVTGPREDRRLRGGWGEGSRAPMTALVPWGSQPHGGETPDLGAGNPGGHAGENGGPRESTRQQRQPGDCGGSRPAAPGPRKGRLSVTLLFSTHWPSVPLLLRQVCNSSPLLATKVLTDIISNAFLILTSSPIIYTCLMRFAFILLGRCFCKRFPFSS